MTTRRKSIRLRSDPDIFLEIGYPEDEGLYAAQSLDHISRSEIVFNNLLAHFHSTAEDPTVRREVADRGWVLSGDIPDYTLETDSETMEAIGFNDTYEKTPITYKLIFEKGRGWETLIEWIRFSQDESNVSYLLGSMAEDQDSSVKKYLHDTKTQIIFDD